MIYLQLCIEFFKIGLFSIGGGLATLPFLYSMAERYPWFTKAEINSNDCGLRIHAWSTRCKHGNLRRNENCWTFGWNSRYPLFGTSWTNYYYSNCAHTRKISEKPISTKCFWRAASCSSWNDCILCNIRPRKRIFSCWYRFFIIFFRNA